MTPRNTPRAARQCLNMTVRTPYGIRFIPTTTAPQSSWMPGHDRIDRVVEPPACRHELLNVLVEVGPDFVDAGPRHIDDVVLRKTHVRAWIGTGNDPVIIDMIGDRRVVGTATDDENAVALRAKLYAAGAGDGLRDGKVRSRGDEFAGLLDFSGDVDTVGRKGVNDHRDHRIGELRLILRHQLARYFRRRVIVGRHVLRQRGGDHAVRPHRDFVVQFRILEELDVEHVADLHLVRREVSNDAGLRRRFTRRRWDIVDGLRTPREQRDGKGCKKWTREARQRARAVEDGGAQ